MTVKFLHNYPARNAVRIISQNRKFAIVTCILQLLGIPMIILTGMLDIYIQNINRFNEDHSNYFTCVPYVSIGSFCLCIAVLLGMFCSIRAFEEEWNKSRVDMLCSLPLSGKQRFFSDYLGGLVMYMLPYLAAVLLGWIVVFIMSPLLLSVNPELNESVSQLYLYYLLFSAGLAVLMWLYYTIAALTASCCGTLFENIYTNLLMNLLIPGTFAAALAVIMENIDGMDFEHTWDFIGFTSPIGGLIYLFYIISEKAISAELYDSYYYSAHIVGGSFEKDTLIPAYLRWFIFLIILTAAVLLLAWKLYERRKAEQVSKPFIFIWIYYVILTAVTLCILCLAEAGEGAFIPVILFSSIIYFIMEVIRKRGFRKFWMSIITYLATVAVASAGYMTTVQTGCFGRTKYIPALSAVTSVEIEFYSIQNDKTCLLSYQDKDKIAEIQDFHKDYLQNHASRDEAIRTSCADYYYELEYVNESDNPYGTYSYYDLRNRPSSSYYPRISSTDFEITYHTIAGTSIHRSYDIYPDEYLHLMQICIGSDVYAEATGNYLEKNLINQYQQYNDKTHKFYIPDLVQLNLNASGDHSSLKKLAIQNAEENLKLLAKTYQQDMQSLTFDSFCKDNILCYVQYLPVYESCTETITLLKEWGFQNSDMSTTITSSISTYDNTDIMAIQIYAPENYRSTSLEYPTFLNSYVYFKQNTAYETLISTNNLQYFPELREVLNHARRNYYSSENCYLLVINLSYYIIPEADSGLVEALIEKGNWTNSLVGTGSGFGSSSGAGALF